MTATHQTAVRIHFGSMRFLVQLAFAQGSWSFALAGVLVRGSSLFPKEGMSTLKGCLEGAEVVTDSGATAANG